MFKPMKTIPGNPFMLDEASGRQQRFFKTFLKYSCLPSESGYNVTASHDHKFIWFRVAKVGTRTILKHLRDNNVILDVEHASDVHYPMKSYQGYYKFAFVRNPWDRLVSCWHNKVLKENYFQFAERERAVVSEFGEFVRFAESLDLDNADRHLRCQVSLINLNDIDYLGRLETFESDLQNITDYLGLPSRVIEPKNVSLKKQAYQSYYTPDLVNRVSRLYRKDIQVFGYKYEQE